MTGGPETAPGGRGVTSLPPGALGRHTDGAGEVDLTRGRAVTYHRVSTVDQHPQNAREELRRAAWMRGLELLEEIEETGSGTKNDRPGLARVLELVRAGEVTHVIVWKLTRFGRSALDLEIQISELERAGVTFVSTSEGLSIGPGAGPIAHLTRRMLSAFAEFERETIAENTRLGMAAARRRGVKLGRPRRKPDVRKKN